MKTLLRLGILGLGLLALSGVVPAHAQATRTWVSGVGDDANPCSRTAPCKTFAGAISKTAIGGIINCLDNAGYGAVTITKSITIDCTPFLGGVLAALTNGINVNGAGIRVTLRSLDIEGIGTGLIGVNIIAAANVHIDKCNISAFLAGTANGVRVATTSGNVEVNISNSYLVDNGTGIAGATSGGLALINLNNSQLHNNTTGSSNNANSRMRVSRVVASGNNTAFQADPGAFVSLNDTDVESSSVTAFSGAWTSFGNNRVVGNVSDGTAPTAAGAASSNLGQK